MDGFTDGCESRFNDCWPVEIFYFFVKEQEIVSKLKIKKVFSKVVRAPNPWLGNTVLGLICCL